MRDESGRRKAEGGKRKAVSESEALQDANRKAKNKLLPRVLPPSAFRFPPLLPACAVLALICGPAAPRAAPSDPDAGSVRVAGGQIRFVALSPVELSRLPRDWQPVRRTEFEKLARQARQARGLPPGVVVSHVTYEATFAVDSLKAGRLSATLRRPRPSDSWLDLGGVNLAISELRQGDREVAWGTTAAGRVMARVSEDAHPLTGSWTLSGERIGQRCRFEVQLIPATASLLKLTLPRGYRLEASAGDVSGPWRKLPASVPSTEAGSFRHGVEWRVAVSSSAATLLTVVPPEPVAAEKPVVLMDSELAYVVRDTGLQIQLRGVPEVLQGSIDSLTFRLPADVKVFSVNYGYGLDTPLDFTTRKTGDSQRLRVRFPDPLLGRGRGVVVQAVAPVRLNQPWKLPKIEAAGTLFLQGRVHLRVERPLEFQSLTTAGLRQSTGVSQSPNGETLSFDSHRPDAGLQVIVGPPPTRTNCRALTHLEVVGEQWRATSELTWTASRGPLYTVRCRAAAGWQIGPVQLVSSLPSETDRTVFWTEQRVERGLRRMSFDLPGGLSAGESVTLRIAATRAARSRRRRLQWPVLAPEGVDRIESIIVMAPGLLPSQPATAPPGFRTLSSRELPEFVRNSKVWKTAAAPGDDKLVIFQNQSLNARRTLILGKPEPGLDGSSWTWVESSSGSVRERFHLSVVPQGEPVDAVLVYLSRKGPSLKWTLFSKGARPEPLRANRLPASRLAAWKLPADGELWEINPPRPTTKPFEFGAAQSRVAGPENTVSLPFLPQARRFVGHVEAGAPTAGRAFQADTNDDLFPIDAPGDAMAHRPAGKDVPLLKTSARLWRYRTAQAKLMLRRVGSENGAVSRSPVDVELWSVLSGSSAGLDAHRIVFHLPPEPRIAEFACRWNDAANVSTVLLNGRPVDTVGRDDLQIIQSLPAQTANTIEFRYTVASADIGWSTPRQVVVPRCVQPVGNFRWHFAIPPHVRLSAGPPAVTVWPVAPRTSWSTRLFGPLARASESPIFNPLSDRTWQQLFELAEAGGPNSGQAPGNGWSPAGWSVHSAAGIDVPSAVTLRLTNRDRSRLWSWIGLLTCLVAGWIIRRAQIAHRRKVGAVWLSLCLAAALFVPGEFAEFAGACLAGTLIATVLSRKVVRREAVADRTASDVPLGSTLSYPRVISTSLILAALGLVTTGALQAFQPPPMPAANGKNATVDSLDSDAVVVPAAADGEKPREGPVVFVHRRLLASLQAAAERALPPRYVLQRANYRVSAVAAHSADVTAAYDVVLFDPDRTTSVLLPIHDAALNGADACRVNGRVQPVRRDAAGRGFVVDVAPPKRKRKAEGGKRKAVNEHVARLLPPSAFGFPPLMFHLPPSAFRLPLSAMGTPRPKPRRCRIELFLQARVEIVRKDDRLRFRIPRVVCSGLELRLPFDSRAVVVPGLSAATADRAWFSQSLFGRLVPADTLEVHWGDGASLTARQSKLTADVQALADVGAANVRVRYRVRYNVESGSVNSVIWNVPGTWVLRAVTLPDSTGRRPAFRRRKPGANGQSRIRIDLPAAHSKPFSLAAEFLVPLRRPLTPARAGSKRSGPVAAVSSPFRISLPRLHSVSPSPLSFPRVEETSNRFAVSSNAEIGISVTPANQAAVRALDKTLYSEFRRYFPGGRQPDYAYELQQPTALMVSITPHSPRRTVRQMQRGRFGGDQLLWTLTADVKVDGAPAYGHDLLVDPRLLVESVRVLEDEAPRLVRWTRSGSRVHLFLSDKTVATQKVILEARMPVKVGALLRLPNARFFGAVTASSQILLSRDSHVGVAVADRGDWERLTPQAASDASADEIVAAAYQLPAVPPAKPRMPQVRPTMRRVTLHARRLTVLKRSKQGGWTAECTLEFRDSLPPSEYSVFLPREIAGAVTLDGQQWTTIGDQSTDTGVLRRLRPNAANGKLPLLTLRFPLAAEKSRRWDLPLPAPRSADLRQDILAIVPDGETVAVTSAAEKVRRTVLPDWMKNRPGLVDAVLFRGRDPLWQLGAGPAESRPDDLKVPFLETCVWLGADNVESGCTQAFIAAPGQSRVEFRWPSGLSLRGVRLNGRPVTPQWKAEGGGRKAEGGNPTNASVSQLSTLNSQLKGRLVVPLDSRSLDFLRIDWERKAGSGWRSLGRHGVEFPSPVSTNATASLVTIVPSRRQTLFRLSGIDALNSVAYSLRRIERLLEVAERQLSPNVAAAVAVESAARAHRSLIQFLKSPRANGQSLDDETRQRLSRIDASLKRARDRFARPGPDPADSGLERTMLFAPAGPTADASIRGELQAADVPQTVRFWQVDRWILAGLLATLALLIALPVARLLFRAEIGERLAGWEPVSWIILGTVWWLFLIPSVVGLVLFSIAVAKLVRRWHRRRTAGNVIRLYDLSQSREPNRTP
jgi:hypothetical protein